MPAPSKPPKFNTLTTAGRIAKAAHTHNCPQATTNKPNTMPPPASSSPPAKKKPRKIPVLAPPSELEAEAVRRTDAAKTKPKSKKKPAKTPLTTQDKLAASKKKKASVPAEHEGAGLKAVGGGEADAKDEVGRGKGEKPRNLMNIMRELGQMGSAVPAAKGASGTGKVSAVASGNQRKGGKGKAKERESVLVRPTERTRRMQQVRQRQQHGEGEGDIAPASPSAKIKREDADDVPSNAQANLMSLPLELRQRIWRLAVVETQFFVYPAINHEQPDLAMTSRQIRGEVLPLYYGENTFAVEIPVSAGPGEGKKKASTPKKGSLEPVKKWVAALADGGHVETIRKWAFSWAPPVEDLRVGSGHAGDREVIVSICYHEPGSAGVKGSRPEVEIHQQAFCLLQSHELFHPCVRRCYPTWLDDAVAVAALAAGQDRGKQIMLVAREVEKMGGELIGSRCEDEVVELEWLMAKSSKVPVKSYVPRRCCCSQDKLFENSPFASEAAISKQKD